MHSLLETLCQFDSISLLKHTGFNIKRNEAMMNKNTKKQFRAYAEAYAHAIKAGFSSADAHYLAETYIENESAKAGN